MGYQALYRVWRPQKFVDLVGQKMITQTLQNAIMTQQTSHAYLFTGPRGTGKTSAAKIFAKAINCHNQKDGEPCNECATCRAITEGRLNDVIEIDAASNNSVDEIRDIRDKVKYAPTQADYKVYIIDEVHMLSTGAFNALLKTLEEPPSNVVFILATTEPHKIPATIISRTQRFDFKRITNDDIIARMQYILAEKNFKYEEKALRVVAKASAGGMRDALSILDQVLSFGNDVVTLENALLVTGSVKHEQLNLYLKLVFEGETAQALQALQEIMSEGKDANRLVEDVIDYCRNLLLYQASPSIVEQNSLLDIDDDFKGLASKTTVQSLYEAIDILNEQQQNMRFSTHSDIYLEVLTVKLSQLVNKVQTNKQDNEELSDASQEEITKLKLQIKELKQAVNNLQKGTVKRVETAKEKKVPVRKKSNTTVDLKKVYPILAEATRSDLVKLKDIWPDLMNMLSITQRAIMNVSKPVAASAKGVIVSFDYDFLYEKADGNDSLKDSLTQGLERLIGQDYKLVFMPKEKWPEIREKYLTEHRENSEKESKPDVEEKKETTEDPQITAAKQFFGEGFSQIVKIKED
ncbi:DNA polymerase III subunit gamma/tau [Liquorilactobacillus mali]|uniref:DNA-directed DNA polymerase n=1 Tax=Liquorilactobacillus mali KCTC 3596 = DSM 20444 TaxID=1046596 RepID=A0A0R2E2S6_9LACO|nr:DNA polymerase III subunit gamma/tau [Liquorilactobacillus mali]KRN09878.1 DNA polymerase III subunits gamma and tau [Liquorilactobacillus mali KCTC 3596 = DSM 20444]MDC7953285.1 DNA polymerase III subunit gamma/tau [Liquorilactobacillus mali]QFQ74162.1 DNA polymerase III subunit gamma/tau [Liquorilactobacillus mali]